MIFPSFKKIVINSSESELLEAQLDTIDFRSRPHILSLHAVIEEQEQCLSQIDEYFKKYPEKKLPYPTFVLTTIESQEYDIQTIRSEEQLPKFFKVKERPLNHKETNLMGRIQLLQKNFHHINIREVNNHFENYAKNHRDIKKLQSEIDFLSQLSEKLDRIDELK
ncbi:MAG: hypothetical protein CME65_00320 [Halobacteriovoraceae bacterium]|nr:hypothetical protein [Halobacteriovoraceae bacterium]|tara:strand:- start:7545 stop:8039 length:495 start_codon:yes stop_codon:yes gene_type:complete